MDYVEYDKFLFFGDSITQSSFSQEYEFGFAAAVASGRSNTPAQRRSASYLTSILEYARLLDVVIRGFSGANTNDAVDIFPHLLPPPAPQCSLRLLTLFFGANDAVLPGFDQHVPLAKFKSNLSFLVTHQLLKVHQNLRIILITPPPCCDHILGRIERAVAPSVPSPQRKAQTTRKYAEAVKEVGNDLQVPVVDLWTAITRACGNDTCCDGADQATSSLDRQRSSKLSKFLYDGLHLSGEGYRVLFSEFMGTLLSNYPELSPRNLEFVFGERGRDGPYTLNRGRAILTGNI